MSLSRFIVPFGLLMVVTVGWLSPSNARAPARATQWQRAEIKKSDYDQTPVSDVIFGEQTIPLEFNHAEHLKEKTGCVFCHEEAEASKSSLDNLIPNEEICEFCHDIDRDEPNKKVEAGEPRADCVAWS